MILYVYSPTFERLALITDIKYLRWEEEYCGEGKFRLLMTPTQENIDLFKPRNYIYRKESLTAMVIWEASITSSGMELEITGYTTVHLFDQRVVYPTYQVTNIETGIYGMINAHLRGLEHVNTAAAQGWAEAETSQHTYSYLLDTVEALCGKAEWGYRMIFDEPNFQHVFTLYRGVDRSVEQTENDQQIFSDEFRNLTDISIQNGLENYRNVAIVAGEGEGAERVVVLVGDTEATGVYRHELYVDARDLRSTYMDENNEEVQYPEEEYRKMLIARGKEKLAEQLADESVTAIVDPTGYGTAYSLGDIVTIKSGQYGVILTARVTSATEVFEKNTTELTITFGTPRVSPLASKVRSWIRGG